jgi:hypothetical protein
MATKKRTAESTKESSKRQAADDGERDSFLITGYNGARWKSHVGVLSFFGFFLLNKKFKTNKLTFEIN